MRAADRPAKDDLLLIGGGHSHALAVRMLAMEPMAGVRVTLVSDVGYAPYSGMLPGFVAGLYTYDEVHIDLRRLCAEAGVGFVRASVTGLDLAAGCVRLAGHPPVRFDRLSLNTGSQPALAVPGARERAVPVKPVPRFLEAWSGIVQAGGAPRIVLAGAGAGGVELALAMRRRLGAAARLTLVDRASEIMPQHAAGARRYLDGLLRQRDVEVLLEAEVTSVIGGVLKSAGREVPYDHLFWVTGACGPAWLADAGLALDERGFVRVHPTLASISDPRVFAAGDVAVVEGQPRPRSGVFAVRHAQPLVANLRRSFQGEPLQPFEQQKLHLSLISTVDGRAVATRGALSTHGTGIWRLKDRIDRSFMKKFAPGEATMLTDTDRSAQRCTGCAAKVGGDILRRALARLQAEDVQADDAAELAIPAGATLVQSVDFLPALVSDPYVFGRVAAAHAFSDIFAMGAEAHSALAIVNVPYGGAAQMEEQIYQLLEGVLALVREIGAKLLGGHTTESPEMALGLSVNGLATRPLWRKAGLAPGQALILTKPLGTGALFAAAMRHAAEGRWLDQAILSMQRPNQSASRVLREHGTVACTDVTGFGLLGHLQEMVTASRVGAQLDLAAVPLLDGAVAVTRAGVKSTLYPHNRQVAGLSATGAAESRAEFELLFDPQTSGGLIAAVPQSAAQRCVDALRAAGDAQAAVIGETRPLGEGGPWIHVN